MKRLFYVTRDLDDAESISDEVHELGIDDHHFYVIARDDQGIKTHHLHGCKTLNNTQILAARKRANFFALILTLLIAVSLAAGTPLLIHSPLLFILVVLAVFAGSRVLTSLACESFDNYFKGVFDDHLDRGEVVIVIDVSHEQADQVERQLAKHPKASFIADSSNIASPIPT